jgi:TPR repeat protein
MQRDLGGLLDCSMPARRDDAGRAFLELGINCTTGDGLAVDLVSAHKWFNLAAMRGNKDAVRLRREIAAEMTTQEITTAQRAAREWIVTH